MFKEKMQAPDYFLNILGQEGPFLLRLQKYEFEGKKSFDEVDKMNKKFSLRDFDEIQYLFQTVQSIRDYSWNLFRLNNLDNKFGKAQSLHFNEVTKEIEIRKK